MGFLPGFLPGIVDAEGIFDRDVRLHVPFLKKKNCRWYIHFTLHIDIYDSVIMTSHISINEMTVRYSILHI